MVYLIAGLLALWIGYLVGQQKHWSTWHGLAAAILVVPLALAMGFDPVLSVVAPLALGVGFTLAR